MAATSITSRPVRDRIPFTSSPLDRATLQRGELQWVEARLGSATTRFLPFWQLKPLVTLGAEPALAWAHRAVLDSMDSGSTPLLLGLAGDVAHFAVDVSGLEKPEDALGVRGHAEFVDARAMAPRLGADDTAMLAHARSLLDWHTRNRFCPSCAAPTRCERAGALRRCPACAAEHFPQSHPVMIAVVSRGDRALLGRRVGWPPNLFSALAGFIEPGENLEDAVRREIREEAGVEVGGVRYIASQPWPFPSSLMLGCLAEGLSETIELRDGELAEARWFTRAELSAALATPDPNGPLALPGRVAIAHHLVRAYLGI